MIKTFILHILNMEWQFVVMVSVSNYLYFDYLVFLSPQDGSVYSNWCIFFFLLNEETKAQKSSVKQDLHTKIQTLN